MSRIGLSTRVPPLAQGAPQGPARARGAAPRAGSREPRRSWPHSSPPRTPYWFASAEDVVALKLVAGRPLGLSDIAGMLAAGLQRLDRAHRRSAFFADRQDPTYGGSSDEHAQFAALEAKLGELSDVQMLYVFDESVVEAPVYLVGRTADGDVVGLTSTRIWT